MIWSPSCRENEDDKPNSHYLMNDYKSHTSPSHKEFSGSYPNMTKGLYLILQLNIEQSFWRKCE